MADTIIVEGLLAHGRHGWRRHQETYPQPFHINAQLFLDLTKVAESDDLADTIDYAAVCEEIKKLVENESYAMIERLADQVARKLLDMGASASSCASENRVSP
ncbi:dihydroneopterin aldolase [Spirillospora sp. CA-255316]